MKQSICCRSNIRKAKSVNKSENRSNIYVMDLLPGNLITSCNTKETNTTMKTCNFKKYASVKATQ